MAHESDPRELGRRMADDVHQVLNGTKPGDIPIYQPTKFEFLINLRAAKALGSPSRIKRTPVILLTPYPTLTLLEELGYVTVSTGESAKKLKHRIKTPDSATLGRDRSHVVLGAARRWSDHATFRCDSGRSTGQYSSLRAQTELAC